MEQAARGNNEHNEHSSTTGTFSTLGRDLPGFAVGTVGCVPQACKLPVLLTSARPPPAARV